MFESFLGIIDVQNNSKKMDPVQNVNRRLENRLEIPVFHWKDNIKIIP